MSETSVKIIKNEIRDLQLVDSLCRDGVDMPRLPYIGKKPAHSRKSKIF